MVRLDAVDFLDATAKLCRVSGVKKTRISIKFRPGSNRIVVKSTDNQHTLTCCIRDVAELKALDHLVNEYVTACIRVAPMEALDTNPKKSAKRGKGKR